MFFPTCEISSNHAWFYSCYKHWPGIHLVYYFIMLILSLKFFVCKILFLCSSSVMLRTTNEDEMMKKFQDEVSFKWKYGMTFHAKFWIKFNHWNWICWIPIWQNCIQSQMNLDSLEINSNLVEEKWDANWCNKNWNFSYHFHHLWLWCWKKKSSEKTQIQKDTFSFHLESIPSQNLFLRDEIVEDL
jgi:hypothetical protein